MAYIILLSRLITIYHVLPFRLDRESDMAALLEATRPALKDVLGKVYSMSRDQVIPCDNMNCNAFRGLSHGWDPSFFRPSISSESFFPAALESEVQPSGET